MIINHPIALPPPLNKLSQAPYETGEIDWDITLESEVDETSTIYTHYNHGIGSMQFWANWKNSPPDDKEIKVKVIAYDPALQREAIIWQGLTKVGEVIVFDSAGMGWAMDIFAPFWRIEFVEMTGAIPPTENNIIFSWNIVRCNK